MVLMMKQQDVLVSAEDIMTYRQDGLGLIKNRAIVGFLYSS